MKLTKELRDRIISKVAADAVAAEMKKLVHKENNLAKKLYDKVYTKSEREAAAAMGKDWLRLDKCLRFNLCGMSVTVYAADPLPVKYSTHCSRLGDIACDNLRDEFLGLQNAANECKMREREIAAKMRALLYSVNTYAQLEKTWPEGKKFYQEYKPKHEQAQVPATLTGDLNAMLGIKAKKVAA